MYGPSLALQNGKPVFFKKHLYKITDLERGGAKNTSTKSQTGGGGCKKIKTTPLQNHKPGGGCANNHFSHIYILGSPLGSSISSHTSKINQNDRTRILNSFPINQTSTNFLYKIRAHYKMTGPGVFKFIANQPNINQFSLQNQGPLQNQRTGPLKYTQKSLTNNPLQNQYSAKIIFK